LTLAFTAAVLGVLPGCGGGSGDSSDAADHPSATTSPGASESQDDATSDAASPPVGSNSAKGPGRDLGDLCRSIPIAGLAAEKVEGKVVVTSLGPRDGPSPGVVCNYGPKDFATRNSNGDKSAVQFSVVYETYSAGSCESTLDAMKRAGNVVKGDHYELTLGAAGVCRGKASLAVARTALTPPSASDATLIRKMLAVAEPRMDDLAERARLDGARS
jgi:hypothetical protein